jgi:2-isopropylmalate synthase
LQIEFSGVVQTVTDATGKELSADDIWNVFDREYLSAAQPYRYLAHHLVEDSTREEVELTTDIEYAGKKHHVAGRGNGPIDAFVHAVAQATGDQVKLLDYHEHSVGAGTNATAVTYIEMRVNEGPSLHGVAMDSNIVTASLKAILSGLNRHAAAVRAADSTMVVK